MIPFKNRVDASAQHATNFSNFNKILSDSRFSGLNLVSQAYGGWLAQIIGLTMQEAHLDHDVHFEQKLHPRRALYLTHLKQPFEISLVVLTIWLWGPLFLMLLMILLLQGGSPFYIQQRVGRFGRTFSMLKFRTMVPNAEHKLDSLLYADPFVAHEWAINQKLKNDPRITRFGRILRASSLDELPQLLNVLRGEMSLVGPRPYLPSQAPLYRWDGYRALRPGISGLWQVTCRNNAPFATRAETDRSYAHQIGLAMDTKILIKTVGVVFSRTGK